MHQLLAGVDIGKTVKIIDLLSFEVLDAIDAFLSVLQHLREKERKSVHADLRFPDSSMYHYILAYHWHNYPVPFQALS